MEGVSGFAFLVPPEGPHQESEDVAINLGDDLPQGGYRIEPGSQFYSGKEVRNLNETLRRPVHHFLVVDKPLIRGICQVIKCKLRQTCRKGTDHTDHE